MTRDELLEKLRELKPRWEEWNIKRMAIFGSYARDEANEDSDVDLLIDTPRPYSLIHLSKMHNVFRDYLDADVDVLYRGCLKDGVHDQILKDCIDV